MQETKSHIQIVGRGDNLERPSVYKFEDIQVYLRGFVLYLKRTEPDFSYRQLAKKAGFGSPNYFQSLLNGQKKITERGIEKLARGFGLKNEEKLYLRLLILLRDAESEQIRESIQHRMREMQELQEVDKIQRSRFEYYNKWFIPVIREMIANGSFPKDLEEASKRVFPKIDVLDVKYALCILETLGFVKKSPDEIWIACTSHMRTDAETASVTIRRFHQQMISLAQKSIDQLPSDQRHASSLTMSVSKSKYSELVEYLNEVKREVANRFADTHVSDEEIYQLNLQFFPLTIKKD